VNRRDHAVLIVSRFCTFIECNTEKRVLVERVAKLLGVSSRSLHNYCQRHLGMSPKRYLDMRRMSHARQALLDSEGNVTVIATRFKFDGPGRFSAQYRMMFGETPSMTIRRGRPTVVAIESEHSV